MVQVKRLLATLVGVALAYLVVPWPVWWLVGAVVRLECTFSPPDPVHVLCQCGPVDYTREYALTYSFLVAAIYAMLLARDGVSRCVRAHVYGE